MLCVERWTHLREGVSRCDVAVASIQWFNLRCNCWCSWSRVGAQECLNLFWTSLVWKIQTLVVIRATSRIIFVCCLRVWWRVRLFTGGMWPLPMAVQGAKYIGLWFSVGNDVFRCSSHHWTMQRCSSWSFREGIVPVRRFETTLEWSHYIFMALKNEVCVFVYECRCRCVSTQ